MKKIIPSLIIGLLIFCSLRLSAQKGLFNEGGIIQTYRNSIIHIDGDVQNKNTSIFRNDGVIELIGNFTNDSTAILTTGSDAASTERAFKFIGAGTQFIYGNVSDTTSRYFYNLIIDKSVSGSPVVLGTHADVKGSLVFGSSTKGAPTYSPTSWSTLIDNSGKGTLRTFDTFAHDYELYITNPAVDAIKGYGSLIVNNPIIDSFIQTRGAQGVGVGGLSRNVSMTGVPYVFPIGTTTNKYNPLSFNFSALGTALDKVRGMFVDAPGGVGNLSLYCAGCGPHPAASGFNYYFTANPCNANKHLWIIFNELPKDHGYWSFAGNSADQYFMVTYPRYPTYGGRGNDIWRTVKKNGSITSTPTGDWSGDILSTVSSVFDLLTYSKNTACYTDSGIPGGSYTGFGSYQMARQEVGAGSALPVEFISLTATAIDNKLIRLQWATAQEINNKGFEIMRSTNAIDFTKIAWIAAKGTGNTTIRSDYRYDDQAAEQGIVYYYKLIQLDYDGQSKETYMVQGSLTGSTQSISVSNCYPNPTTGNSKITIRSTNNIALTIDIYNMAGQLLEHRNVQATAGESSLDINTEHLPSGLYDIVLRTDENSFSNKLNIIK